MDSRIPPDVLAREQAFFDHEAAELDDRNLAMPAGVIDRYRHARISALSTPKDTLFALAMPLEGKRVLDYGCGSGENSCLLAACGADVTAFDLSPVSIARARRRAELMGLSDRIHFDVSVAGETTYPDGSFDIIVGFSILHHLRTDLDHVYDEINRLLAVGGTVYFIEPVANSTFLRTLRRLVPVARVATKDERQLQYRDLDRLQEHGFARVEYRHFYCLVRLHRLLGESVRRPLRLLDYCALRIMPFLKSSYGLLLVTARRE